MTKKVRTPRRDKDQSQSRSPSVANPLPRMIQENATLQSRNQLLLMYSSFQTEMPTDGKTGVGTWLQTYLSEYGMPSLVRFGPRNRPQVLRRDEFADWFRPFMPS